MKAFWYRFGKKEEIEFANRPFKGKAAGIASKYSRYADTLVRIRVILLVLAFYMLFGILLAYMNTPQFATQFLVQGAVFAGLYIVAFLLYNNIRLFASFLALIPSKIFLVAFYFIEGEYTLYAISIQCGIIVLIIWGVIRHFQMKAIKKQLEKEFFEQ